MKVQIFGSGPRVLKSLLMRAGISIGANPDAVITYGGDGTLLEAERRYPGIPKLRTGISPTCQKCRGESARLLLEKLKKESLRIKELIKLEARIGSKRMIAINDVVIHNAKITSALRYRVFLGDTLYADEVIGDGIVVATPFGSGGYYRSITDSTFTVGIGLAFNNSTRQVDHTVFDEDMLIKVEIIRGPALLGVDNTAGFITVPTGKIVVVKKAKEKARVFEVDRGALLCDECRRTVKTNRTQNEKRIIPLIPRV